MTAFLDLMSDPEPQDDRRPRVIAKSATAFRTISEVSTDLAVPQHVLRFWETKFPQVKPLKRGGGRRYYRPEDVDLLRRIRDLLYDQGYTIKGVQKLLRDQRGGRPAGAPDQDDEGGEGAGILVVQDQLDVAADAGSVSSPPTASPAAELPAAPRLTAAQRGRIQTVITELRALRELLRQPGG
jgi:DNA-binding transcriptional MerR regulator